MEMEITFPGGVAVDAGFKGFTVHTDQPAPLGEGGGPQPFDLFLAAIGTCAGFYAVRFCQERQISTTGLRLRLATEKDPVTNRLGLVRIAIELPAGFPEKYHAAIIRATEQCSVKRSIATPPRFETEVVVPAATLPG